MLKEGMSRRQFIGGTAACTAAAAMPSVLSAAPAMADAGFTFPIAAAQTSPWIPLDPTAAAREALEIYRGMRAGQGG